MLEKSILLILIIININNIFPTTSNYTKIKEIDKSIPTIGEEVSFEKVIEKEKPVGNIKINMLNLTLPLYDINSKFNNIELNVEILNTTTFKNPSKILLAAHSGNSNISYFKNINKLNIGSSIEFNYKDISNIYEVVHITEIVKDGDINFSKTNFDELILTTCSPNNKNNQILIIAKKIEN